MTARRRATRLLGAATVATVAVTVLGVLLGPSAPDSAQASTGDPPAPTATEPEGPPEVPVPTVAEQRRSDFTAGDGLPEGARMFDSGGNASDMTLTAGVLSHGVSDGPAAGFVETRLDSDVAALGVRVRFPGLTSGSVALVGWQESLVRSRKDFGPTPATGMRLVAGPGHWELSTVDRESRVIQSGTYEPVDGPATFELVREGSTLYVVDPTGLVTVVTDKRVGKLAGPWASWGLSETGPEQVPASIEAVWAG